MPMIPSQAWLSTITPEELVSRADQIVVGRVVRTESQLDHRRQTITTTVTVKVGESLKGGGVWGEEISFGVPGGTYGQFTLWVEDTPVFESGENVFLFLKTLPTGEQIVAGGSQGVLSFGVGDPSVARAQVQPVIDDINVLLTGTRRLLHGAWSPHRERMGIPARQPSAKVTAPRENRWSPAKAASGISWYINLGNWQSWHWSRETQNQAIQAVQRGVQAWDTVSTADLKFIYRGKTQARHSISDGQNVIFWDDQANWNIDEIIGAKTFITSNNTTGQFVDVDILLSTKMSDDSSRHWTGVVPTDNIGPRDIWDVVSHEMGHFLGINHLPNSDATMYYTSGRTDTFRRDVTQRDIDALTQLYPRTSGWTSKPIANDRTPDTFLLEQNYPNPFNPTTTIRFTLPQAAPTELTIYNIAGQRVRVLLNEQMAAGIHTVVWDGNDQAGRVVAAGLYLYRLSTNAATTTRQMLLVR
ncbi:MAG: T9SS type A sorting domain-containing protein [Candidatus Latescibacteria bacterium]|nr:T9SS type A sorting domain-containing protein [Candidatus Latescibacterota bacterium]